MAKSITVGAAVPASARSGSTSSERAAPADQRLRLPALTALVVGSMIGSGIFALPQNMASGAGPGAVVIGWLITGVGMLALALVYQALSDQHPDLNNGVYAYARASAGEFAGFNSAWGYWISAWIGNVGYLVIFFSALGHFFPVFGEGNTPAAIIGASVALWLVHALVLSGIRSATLVNTITTIAKVLPLLLFIALAALAFNAKTFGTDFWGATSLGSVSDQVKSTMLITVWAFIGIEGANVYSARAAERRDIGRATAAGFVIVLLLLMAVSLLSLGVLPQAELAALKNPSMAGVLERVVGPWGAAFISIALMVSVGGAFLAWTLLAAETLFTPARDSVMPRFLTRQNSHGAPANALWVTSALVQLFLLIALWASATYQALIMLATSMILVPYLFTGWFAVRSAWSRPTGATSEGARRRDLAIGAVATVYCLWLLYAAGLKYLLFSALLYAPGALLYWWATREQGRPMLRGFELALLIAILVAASAAMYLLATGTLKL